VYFRLELVVVERTPGTRVALLLVMMVIAFGWFVAFAVVVVIVAGRAVLFVSAENLVVVAGEIERILESAVGVAGGCGIGSVGCYFGNTGSVALTYNIHHVAFACAPLAATAKAVPVDIAGIDSLIAVMLYYV